MNADPSRQEEHANGNCNGHSTAENAEDAEKHQP